MEARRDDGRVRREQEHQRCEVAVAQIDDCRRGARVRQHLLHALRVLHVVVGHHEHVDVGILGARRKRAAVGKAVGDRAEAEELARERDAAGLHGRRFDGAAGALAPAEQQIGSDLGSHCTVTREKVARLRVASGDVVELCERCRDESLRQRVSLYAVCMVLIADTDQRRRHAAAPSDRPELQIVRDVLRLVPPIAARINEPAAADDDGVVQRLRAAGRYPGRPDARPHPRPRAFP